MARLDENQMVDQVDSQHRQKGGRVARAGDVGAAGPRFGGGVVVRHEDKACAAVEQAPPAPRREDRKSVVSGTRVSVRVDLGGRRIIKKKITKNEEGENT